MAEIIAVTLQANGDQAKGQVKDIGAEVAKTTTTVRSYREEIKQATLAQKAATEQFGPYSKAALDAAQKLGQLKNEMGDAAKLANQFNTDGSAGLQAFGTAVRGVAGGFAALQGAAALFGAESEDVQKTLLKVQAALALSEGLNNISELGKSFNTLSAIMKSNVVVQGIYSFATTGRIKATVASTVATEANAVATAESATAGEAAALVEGEQAVALEAQTVATVTATTATGAMSVAMTVLRTALIATGIGALVIGLIAAYQAFQNFANGAEEAAKKQDELNKKVVEFADIGLTANVAAAKRDTETAVARAKARGASEDEIFKIQKAGLQRQADALKAHYQEVAGIDQVAAFKDQQQVKDIQHDADILTAGHDEASREAYKKSLSDKYTLAIDANKKQEELAINSAKIAGKGELDIFNIQQTALTKRLNLLHDYLSKATGLGQDYYNGIKKQLTDAEHDLTVLQLNEEQIRFNAVKNLNEKLKKDFVAELEAPAQSYSQKVANGDITQAVDIAGQVGDSKTAEQKAKDLRDFNQQQQNNKLDETTKGYQQQLQALDQYHQEEWLKLSGNASAQIALDAEVAEQKKKIAEGEKDFKLGLISSFADQAADIVGRDTVTGKAFAITSAVINTYLGATKALATLPPPYSFIQAGLTVITGLKAVANIVNTPVPGKGSSGSAPSTGGFSVPSSPLQPTTPQQSNTTLNQDQLNQLGNATVRAFVVEADVASNAERTVRLNRAARLGG